MKTLSVEFNGVRLDDYLVVTKGFNRGIGTSRDNNSVKVANRRGRVYLDHTYDQGDFDMPFTLIYDVINKRRELAKILNVSEPAPLIFGDEPDKVYYAVPKGDINVDETNFLGKGTITWEVPDGVSYAVEEKVVTNVPEPVTVISDFKDKTAGSNVGNPNFLGNLLNPVLQSPTANWTETSTAGYGLVSSLNGVTFSPATSVTNYISQVIIKWNILEIVVRKYPELQGITVDKLKTMINKIGINTWGRGSGVSGNLLRVYTWYPPDNGYALSGSNVTNNIEKVAINLPSSGGTSFLRAISSDGMIYNLLSTYVSNGTIPSSVSFDYANIEITLQLPKSKRLVLINEGTDNAYPVFDVKTKGDNGLIALVSTEGIVQYGNPNEVDGVTVQKSTKPVNQEFDSLTGIVINPPGFTNGANGIVTGSFVADGHLKVSDYGAGAAWHGPMAKIDLAGLPTNFSFQTWAVFKYDDLNRFGMIRLGAWDDTGKNIAELSLIKGQSNNFVLPILNVGGVSKAYSDNVADNFKDFYGLLQIDKFQDVITFKVQKEGGRYIFLKSFNTAIHGQKLKSITIWMSQFGTQPAADLRATLTDVWAHNANVWDDVPNKFSGADNVVIDHDKGKIYKNGLLDMLDADYGSKYFSIPPGETEVQLILSDFAEVDVFKARYRELYL